MISGMALPPSRVTSQAASITALTYEQLLAFYRRHYHPSNAVFMTFGDIPAGSADRGAHRNA